MDLATIGNAIISGLLTGLVYGLSALGLSVIFGVIRIVNFAHGEIMVIGMFFALILFRTFGIDPLLSVPLAVVVLFLLGGGAFGSRLSNIVFADRRRPWLISGGLFALGFAMYWLSGHTLLGSERHSAVLNAFIDAAVTAGVVFFVLAGGLYGVMLKRVAHLPEHMQFLLLAAIAIVIVSGSLLAFGPDPHGVDVPYALDSFAIGELIFDKTKVYAAVTAVLVAGLLLAFFKYTATGKAIRACADNYLGAQVVGLNVDRLYAFTFGIGAACLGAAGCVILLIVEVHPYLAPSYTLLAFVVVIIGGLGSLPGALLGGLLIGLSEDLAALWEPSFKSAFSFGLLILVLLLRPQGLLGKASH